MQPLSDDPHRTTAHYDGITQRTERFARAALEGRRGGLRAFLPFVGPAMIASVGYMDPGNYATNIEAGARYGYGLLWVVIVSSAVAMLFQALSARVGIATGRNLAELCRDSFPQPLVVLMWITSEVAAMATDLAEFLGGALAVALLLHLPLLAGMAVTAVVTFAVLALEKNGFRPIELTITAMVAMIGLSYVCELWISPPDWTEVAVKGLIPHLQDRTALTLAVGIVGATIMPHTLYLHSGLVQARTSARSRYERATLLRFSNREVVLALGAAGVVNMAMVVMASSAFHKVAPDVSDIGAAYDRLIPTLGAGAGAIFLVGLMASGISSSVVGTMAGQLIMQGFSHFNISIAVRRLLTIVPSFVVVMLGCNVTHAMLASQVVLSMSLPIPMLSLLVLSGQRSLMGELAASKGTLIVASISALIVIALNGIIIAQVFE
jgi:manganese transport protein